MNLNGVKMDDGGYGRPAIYEQKVIRVRCQGGSATAWRARPGKRPPLLRCWLAHDHIDRERPSLQRPMRALPIILML